MQRFQTLIILTTLIALFAWVGYVILGALGAILILALGLTFNLLSARTSARLILHYHRARPIQPHHNRGLYERVRSLAQRAQVPVPQLAVYPSDIPNAFALTAHGGAGVIAVSSSLPRILEADEIEAVLAHEIAHLRNRDSLLSLTAGLFVQSISTVSSLFGFLLFIAILSGIAPPQATLGVALLVIAAPHAASALHAGPMRTRERLADRDAAMLTGHPRLLASALVKLERYNRYLAGIIRRFRFIYTSQVEKESGWFRTHPTTTERVEALLGLKRTVRYLAPSGVRMRLAQ